MLFYLHPLNESQGMGEEGELHLGGGVGKVGPTPKGRQTICFALDVVLGVGRAQEGQSPLPLPFVLILEMRHKGSYVLFLPENPCKETHSLFECALCCCEWNVFSFKNNFEWGAFFPVLKIEKFLQYKQGCGGGGVGAVRGH